MYQNFNIDDLKLVSRQHEEYSTSYDFGYLKNSIASFYISKNVSLVIENINTIMDTFGSGAAVDSITRLGDGFRGVSIGDIEDALGLKFSDEVIEACIAENTRGIDPVLSVILFSIFILALVCLGMYILPFLHGC